MHKSGFPPIADAQATTLILGSMPGEQSLRANQYYANRHNAFWRIMGCLFGFAPDTPYAARTRVLLQQRIALWDVIQGCERPGSLDSAIDGQSIVANDFGGFYSSHPQIQRVFFNGLKAEQEYAKRVLSGLPDSARGIVYLRLPSTSPAMAMLSFEQKLSAWSQALSRR
ncbi:MAG: DNA-deoxyinosine glycosylase [Gammaproteobacteria bacterium]